MTREGRPSNLAASIRDRLLNKARTERLDFNLLLTRYALERFIYPIILPELPEPQIRVYPRDTVVAEKLEALTSLGMLNSRMKDLFDLWVLSKQSEFEGPVLSMAVAATFGRRRTPIPRGVPIGLSDEFINDAQKVRQWQGFVRKNALDPVELSAVIIDLRDFLLPVLVSAATGDNLDMTWQRGDRWR